MGPQASYCHVVLGTDSTSWDPREPMARARVLGAPASPQRGWGICTVRLPHVEQGRELGGLAAEGPGVLATGELSSELKVCRIPPFIKSVQRQLPVTSPHG
jgi:hypothetical protein